MAGKRGKTIRRKEVGDERLLVLLNIIIPGLGSYLAGEKRTGRNQLVLFVMGILGIVVGILLFFLVVPLVFLMIGYILIIISWIWGLVTIIQIISK